MPHGEERQARSVALEKAYVHDVYEQFSEGSRGKPWPKVNQFLADLEPGSLVCDVGCGNGKYLNVNPSVYNVGVDKCARLSEAAREKSNEILVCDNLSLPFRDESFDAALSIAVVHHFATTERRVCALRELARVLRIGGRLIISVWAMEQTHRKFESQDVLVPWHRPQTLSTPSLELTSTTTTSEDDGLPPYHAYTQTSDTDSNRSLKNKAGLRKRARSRHKGRSIDPGRSSSPSSSSLSSPNETCYSFVRRALQKLAGGRRSGHTRPWFLDTWSACTKEPPPRRYEPDGCECCENDDIRDLPIELRRVDDDDLPQRRQTFPSSQMVLPDIYTGIKSKSLTDIKTCDDRNIVRSQSSIPSLQESINDEGLVSKEGEKQSNQSLNKPRLVKQKKSICDEDAEEDLDKPTDMKSLVRDLPDFRMFHSHCHRGSVYKQRSMNEELMYTERLKEKERVKQNIQKQTSLNEELIYQRQHTFDSIKDSIFSVSTSKRFQLIKTGFTNKLKTSTTNIEKVAGTSLKNGFVRILQSWKSTDLTSPTKPQPESVEPTPVVQPKPVVAEEKKDPLPGERRHSREDGSDSSKDSSLQSDTSVDSEDSFASVIFVPKPDPSSPSTLSPGPASPRLKQPSVPSSPHTKQSSCPTSPRIKQMPLTVHHPLTKQLSSPKPSTSVPPPPPPPPKPKPEEPPRDQRELERTKPNIIETLAQKYSVVAIPKFRRNLDSNEKTDAQLGDKKQRNDRLQQIRELLNQRPGFGVRTSRSSFPLVRHSSTHNGGKNEPLARPLPRLLSLELFNPETDDKDSDSSGVSSPDSVDSVISVEKTDLGTNNTASGPDLVSPQTKFPFQTKLEQLSNNRPVETKRRSSSKSLLQAAADVANSLDEAVDAVIQSSPKARHRQLHSAETEVLSVMQRQYDATYPDSLCSADERRKHLTDFANKLSEKLLLEIDQYNERMDDPYMNQLSEELEEISKLSAEIQKQNEYLASLNQECETCTNCRTLQCKCEPIRVVPKIVESDSLEQGSKLVSDETNDVAVVERRNSGKTTLQLSNSVESNDTADISEKTVSSDSRETNSASRYSDITGSTASLGSCADWNQVTIKNRFADGRSSSEEAQEKAVACEAVEKPVSLASMSDTSQDSLPSDNMGGAITYHRYYHVFREGELDQLIERYVDNLHIISSYYDHASWCVIAEKVQVWTI